MYTTIIICLQLIPAVQVLVLETSFLLLGSIVETTHHLEEVVVNMELQEDLLVPLLSIAVPVGVHQHLVELLVDNFLTAVDKRKTSPNFWSTYAISPQIYCSLGSSPSSSLQVISTPSLFRESVDVVLLLTTDSYSDSYCLT